MKIAQKIVNTVQKGLSGLRRTFTAPRAGETDLLADRSGEAYIGEAVKILIAVVIGALLLGLIYALINDTVFPEVTKRIKDLFDFKG